MLLTIITICLNEKESIQKTIDSIISQTWQNFEWIVVDGGSTDGTFEKFVIFRKKITSLITGRDSGIYDAMNKGISVAQGDYILFLNGGDHFINNRSLENAIKKLNNKAEINYCPILFENMQQFIVNKKVTDKYLWERSLPHGGSFISKKLFASRKYNVQYKIAADYEFFIWAYFKKRVKIHLINEPLIIFYRNGISNLNKDLLLQEISKIKNTYFNLYHRIIYNDAFKTKINHIFKQIKYPRYTIGKLIGYKHWSRKRNE